MTGRVQRTTPRRVGTKCAQCSLLIADGDLVIFLHGDLIHLPCWRKLSTTIRLGESAMLARRSRELIEKSAELAARSSRSRLR